MVTPHSDRLNRLGVQLSFETAIHEEAVGRLQARTQDLKEKGRFSMSTAGRVATREALVVCAEQINQLGRILLVERVHPEVALERIRGLHRVVLRHLAVRVIEMIEQMRHPAGTVLDERKFCVLGGDSDAIYARMKESPLLTELHSAQLSDVVQLCRNALSGPDRILPVEECEIAILKRAGERRSFTRLDDAEVNSLVQG